MSEADQAGTAPLVKMNSGQSESARAHEPVQILAVDDNPGNLLALETALAPLGVKIVCASSGSQALRQLLSHDFATVILDINMPDLDGFETARMIRSRVRSAVTPIIFISAVSMDEADVRRGYSLGAVDYLCAPYSPEVLRAKVAVFVELHRKTEEARRQAEHLRERTRELERSQRELRHAERMASLGTLCIGIGHDMGNLLLPISVWIDSVQSQVSAPEFKEGVENLRACVQYLRQLASGLRLVALEPAHDAAGSGISLAEWAAEVSPVLRTALPRGVTLEIDVPDSLPSVRITSHRLAQAVFNLVQNAGEAMRERESGLIRISATAVPERGVVEIDVSDNGPGMSAEVRARCMDPFFTTKARGISTGLGLSLVHGVVHSAGGSLDVHSEPGKGTTFRFGLAIDEYEPPVRASVVLTVDDPRTRALMTALVNATGCDLVPEVLDDENGTAIWITDIPAGLEQGAQEFLSLSGRRRVFLVSGSAIEIPGVETASLTGTNALAGQLRRFLSESAYSGAVEEAPAWKTP